jgi:catechol 2,3-dioxygenase-like lactoylglutathione lyase family enzyme
MRQRLSIVTLGVRDLTASRAFYAALGWTPVDEEGEITFFDLGGVRLALYPRQALADDAEVDASGTGFPGFTLAHNEPSPEAVDGAFAEAVSAGGRPVKAPQSVFWGGYSGYVADPDGFLWEIAFNPFTDLT